MKHANGGGANFRDAAGKLQLVRCYECVPVHGRENYAPNISSGRCTWCGWSEEPTLFEGCGCMTEHGLVCPFRIESLAKNYGTQNHPIGVEG